MYCAQVSYCIKSNLKQFSDYIPLTVNISITLENICIYRIVLKCDSKEVVFLLYIIKGLSQLNFYTLDSVASFDSLSETISKLFDNYWTTYAKRIIITTQSKKWWNNECKTTLETYRQTGKYFD